MSFRKKINVDKADDISLTHKNSVQDNDQASSVKFSTLFRYATRLDKLLVAIGIVSSILSGMMFPLLSIVFGILMDGFMNNHMRYTTTSNNSTSENMTNCSSCNGIKAIGADDGRENLRKKSFVASGIIMAMAAIYFITVATYVWTLNKVARKQSYCIKKKFMEAVLHLNIGYMERSPNLSAGSIATTLLSNLASIEEGIGEPIGNVVSYTTVIVFKIIASLYISWKLTLILLSLTPFVIGSIGLIQWSASFYSNKQRDVKSVLGSICQESFSMIKTVIAFNGQKCEISRFNSQSSMIKDCILWSRIDNGIGMGLFFFLTFVTYGLGVYVGTKFMVEKSIEGPSLGASLAVFWNVAMISMMIVTLGRNLTPVMRAKNAATPLFHIIDSRMNIANSSSNDTKLSTPISNISISGITFSYPSRPNTAVLRNISMKISRGQTIALVGPSGSGKSCLLELLQRLYDVHEGQISMSENEIKSYDRISLRNQISVIGQEPVLFEGTIAENILLGKGSNSTSHGMDMNSNTMNEIVDAAKRAHAHEFINRLPNKYQTILTDKVQLSGGQKQRIAIARALIKKSSLLLLDEATSALDSESSALINEAIENERNTNRNQIMIIVAHKLDDIKYADVIHVFQNGSIIESGTHGQLISKGGLYAEMYEAQKMEPVYRSDSDDSGNLSAISDISITSFRRSLKRHSISIRSDGIYQNTKSVDEAISETKYDTAIDLKYYSPLWKMLMRRKYSLIVGIVSTIIGGFWIPFYAILIGDFTRIVELDDESKLSESKDIGIRFSIAGAIILAATIGSGYFFGKVSSNLSNDIRSSVFQSIINKPIPWFEKEENNVGTSIVRIISNVDSITSYANEKFPGLVQNVSTLIACIIVAVYHSWKLTIVVLIFVPLHCILAFLESKISVSDGENKSSEMELENMTKLTIQVVENIKTVTSFNLQKHFLSKFDNLAKSMYEKSRIPIRKRALIVGASKAAVPFIYSITFFVATHWISTDELRYDQFLKVTEGVLFACFFIAEDSILSFDLKEVKSALRALIPMIDEQDDMLSVVTGTEMVEHINGPIVFEAVDFSYPSRSETKILKQFNLNIKEGTKVGIVGESGCGKSTLSQLLLKYYTPCSGSIKLNGCDINHIESHFLRSQISIVNQEPDLFSFSIMDNIAYGSYGDLGNKNIMGKIKSAAMKAQIHDAIMRLPDGYQTMVGDKGSQLSGGQKQRIAIARAFLRNTNILILDEATSALDVLSKRLVEEAINEVSKDKIVISITHDSQGLEKYDKTYYMSNGRILECVEKIDNGISGDDFYEIDL